MKFVFEAFQFKKSCTFFFFFKKKVLLVFLTVTKVTKTGTVANRAAAIFPIAFTAWELTLSCSWFAVFRN